MCDPILPRQDNESDEEDEPEGGLAPPWTRSVGDRGNRKRGLSDSSSEVVETHHSAPTRQYCSQACLLGLKKDWDLDDSCPNVLLHRDAGGGGIRHPVTADTFTRLVDEQLLGNPYQDCAALDWRVEKGAIDCVMHLRHDWSIYGWLNTLQGWVMHLGLVPLNRGYVLPGGMKVVHMMLMSWGGERAAEAGIDAASLEMQHQHSSQAILAQGIDHGDERDASLYCNVERRRVNLINFDRAIFRPALNHRRLSAVSATERKCDADYFTGYSRKRVLICSPLQSV
ncbi:hypothetical protein PG993_010802 [Apiospora rasikravindrae]|uniref:Uncharacterized protein n=1 Tax=Apiospora rasikravindrae TaxID=990691 RepID=A0ABR1SCD9_9PEZI